jgi:hypothetical protein
MKYSRLAPFVFFFAVGMAQADIIGNALGPRLTPDVNTTVLALANNSPILAAGTVDTISIYSGDASGTVIFALFHNTSGSTYQVIDNDVFSLTGIGVNTDTVNWAASAGDVFGVYGPGATFDEPSTPAPGDAFNLTFVGFKPTVGFNFDFADGTYAYPGQTARVYSLQAQVTPAATPEPSSFLACGAGIGLLALRRRRNS